jgi:hypothetical protein
MLPMFRLCCAATRWFRRRTAALPPEQRFRRPNSGFAAGTAKSPAQGRAFLKNQVFAGA